MVVSGLQKTLGAFSLCIDRLAIGGPGVYGLIGPNGSGKSTAAKLCAGILAPDAGTIDLEGLRPRDITMITQKPYIMDDTVYNNLVYPLKLRGIRPDAALCDRMLEQIDLSVRRGQRARGLSGGERQKLALCRAMIFKPKMIIADESLAGLDIDSLDMFEKLILDTQQKRPIIWLMISHQLPHIRRLCGYLFCMSGGRLAAEGPTEELFASEIPAVRRYVWHEAAGEIA
jgi:ABC-type multidrug transport system ATPase subunit